MSKPKSNRRFLNYKTLLSILISVAGLYLGFRKFDVQKFLDALRQTHLILFIISMGIMIFMTYLRAWRWQYLVMPIKKISMKDMFAAEMICYFGNNVFPMRLGEVLRSYSLSKMSRVSAVSIFGTVITERILDTSVFLLIVMLSAILFPSMPATVRLIGLLTAIFIVILVVIIYIFRSRNISIVGFLRKRLSKYSQSKVYDFIKRLLSGISTLRHTPHLGLIITQSIIVWLISLINFWIMGATLETYFTLPQLLLIFFVTSAIISIPSAPGYVGTYHAGAIGILLYFGMELSKAQALAVIMHAVGFISLTLIGLIYFLKYHVALKETSVPKVKDNV